METSASSRFGVIAAIAVMHIALIWWLTFGLSSQPLTPPTPLPAMMVELLAPPQPVAKPEPPKPQAPKPQIAPQPKPEPKPKAPPKKATPRPVDKTPAPKPAPLPEPAMPVPAAPAPPVAAAPAPPAPTPPAPPAPPAPQPLSPPRFNVAYLKNPLPPYPPMLRRAGQEGKVTLRVYVLADGRAGEVKVDKSSGFPMFDEAALNTVKEWKFQPGKRGDTPEAQWVLVPINFTLN